MRTTDADRYRILARLFTRPVLRELGQGTTPAALRTAIQQGNLALEARALVCELFESAYEVLVEKYRSEYVYKNTIANKIIFGLHSPATASLITEFRVNQSLADTVVFNGTSAVYEIKTELDDFSRLPSQIADYSRVFDRIWVVTSETGRAAAERIAAKHVGILVFTKRGTLTTIRSAISNNQNVDPATIFACMRKAEYLSVLQRTLGWIPDVPSGALWLAAREHFCRLAPTVAHTEMVRELRARTTNKDQAEFLSALPQSLRALGLSEPMSPTRRDKTLGSLFLPVTTLIA